MWIFVSRLWSDQSEFMADCFELIFNFFNSHIPVTTLGPDLFSGTYMNKLLFLLCPVIENNSV